VTCSCSAVGTEAEYDRVQSIAGILIWQKNLHPTEKLKDGKHCCVLEV